MKVIITLKEKTGIGRSFDHEYDLKEVLERRHWDAQRWEVINVAFVQPPPTTEQTELWKEKIARIIFKHVKGSLNPIGIIGEKEAANEILELLSRRSEQNTEAVECICKNSLQAENCTRNCGHGDEPEVPEAVEFANWCVDLYQWSDTEEIWVDNQGEKYSGAELYELYKKQKP